MQFYEQIFCVLAFLAVLVCGAQLIKGRGKWTFPFAPSAAGRPRKLELIEKLSLTPQFSLHLVRLAGRELLIGVSPAGGQLIQPVASDEKPSGCLETESALQ